MAVSSNATGKQPVSTTLKRHLAAFGSPRRPHFWVLLAVVVYTLAGFFLAPVLVERAATGAMRDMGRSLALGKVRVNPYLLTLQVQDAKLQDIDGSPLFSFGNLFANFQLSSLFHWAWTFKAFQLDGLTVNFERFPSGEGRVTRFVTQLAKGDAPAPPPKPDESGLPRLIVQQVTITDTNIEYSESGEQGRFETSLGPINVELSNLSTLPDETGRQQVSITTETGGTVAWSGSLELDPLRSEGTFTLASHNLQERLRYAQRLLPYQVQVGAIDASLSYRIEEPQPGDLRLRTDDLDATVADIGVTLNGEQQPLLSLPQLKLAGGGLRWPEKRLELGSVDLSGLTLNVVAEAGGALNVARLAPAGEAGEPATAPDGATNPGNTGWAASLERLGISGGTVNYSDQAIEPAGELTAQDLAVTVTGPDTNPGETFPTTAELQLANGGSVRFDGKVGFLPGAVAQGRLNVTGMALAVIQPWLEQALHVKLESGALDLDGEASLGPGEPAAYQGRMAISDFELADTRAQQRLAGWQTMDVNRLEVSLGNHSLQSSQVQLTHPYGRIEIAADQSPNLDGLAVEKDTAAAATAPAAASVPMALTVDGFKIADAELDFSDLSLPLPFAAEIRAMGGTISTLSTTSEEPARIDLTGQVNEYGQARIGGSIDAWRPDRLTDVLMNFRNIDITRMTPYSIKFAGWKIASGRMDLDLDYHIENGDMLGKNKIVIREMEVGDKVEEPGAGSLPLKLAIALLKDPSGVIDVDLPVSGNVNDPNFHIGGVVWKAVLNLITKIATAPFRLLANLVGAGGEDFGTLVFEAGSAGLSPPDREQLAKLAEAMAQRPQLTLEVGGVYAPQADGLAMREQAVEARLQERMAQTEQSEQELSTVIRRRALEAMFSEAFPNETLESVQAGFMRVPTGAEQEGKQPPAPQLDETAYAEALRQRLIEKEPVTDAELRALAQARADAIVAVLQQGAEAPGAAAGPRVERVDVEEVKAGPGEPVKLELKVTAEAPKEASAREPAPANG